MAVFDVDRYRVAVDVVPAHRWLIVNPVHDRDPTDGRSRSAPCHYAGIF